MGFKYLVLSFLLFFGFHCEAQTDSLYLKDISNNLEYNVLTDQDSLIEKEGHFEIESLKKTSEFLRIADAFAYTLTSPIRWEDKDWLTFGATLGGTVLLSAVADKPVNRFMEKNHEGFSSSVGKFGYHNGKPYTAAIVAGGFYVTGYIIDDEWTKETASILTAAYLTSGVLQTGLKKLVGRARPYTELGNYEFRPFQKGQDFSSFPSGHSQIAFVTAMVLAERVDQTWLKVVFYTGAGITMASRMYENAHWISDVAFGGLLGYFCTRTVIKRFEQNKYGKPFKGYSKNKIDWQIIPSYNGIGLIGTF